MSLLLMWRELLRISALYGSLMESVSEVGVVVGPCDRMVSLRGSLVGSSWYNFYQSNV